MTQYDDYSCAVPSRHFDASSITGFLISPADRTHLVLCGRNVTWATGAPTAIGSANSCPIDVLKHAKKCANDRDFSFLDKF
jgi:hypothetical protein